MSRVDDLTVRTLLDFEVGAQLNFISTGFSSNSTSIFQWSPVFTAGPGWFGAINLLADFRVLAGGGEWQFDSDLRLRLGATQYVDTGASIIVANAATIDFLPGSDLLIQATANLTINGGTLGFIAAGILNLGVGCVFNADTLSTVNLDGTTDVDGDLTITNGAFLFAASGATLTAQSGSIVSLLSGAQVPKRHLSINTSPTASIVGKSYDFVLISAGTGPATYTIDDTGAVTGDLISFVTTSATQPATIKDPGGGTLAILLNSAPGDKIRIDVMRVGVTWTVISTYYL